ncbi:MAG: sigma-70 family RNA polymerase sigma factor [Blastocatellia bacterium]
MSEQSKNITMLLTDWKSGNKEALEIIINLLYDELHALADKYLRHEQSDHILQATALINEVVLRLMQENKVDWQNRCHFIAIAANTMRRVLIDFSRNRSAKKRAGELYKITLTGIDLADNSSIDLIELNDALNSLETIDPRQGKVVELMFFGGLTLEETAEVMEISVSTVRREWNMARAWLHHELTRNI